MLRAITRSPGPELAQCELTYLERTPIDFGRALTLHRAYQEVLRRAGVEVIELPADPELPDGVFVEDTAVILDEFAIITTPKLPSRRKEVLAVEEVLRIFRPLVRLPEGAQLEGGDVLVVGRTLYVGQSQRTTEKGTRALERIVIPFGYKVVPVRVLGCLHLKTGCFALGEDTLLVNREWVDASVFTGFRLVEVPVEEPWGANVLVFPNLVIAGSAFPRTVERVQRLGHSVVAVDVSELQKAEAGLTCMSILFARR